MTKLPVMMARSNTKSARVRTPPPTALSVGSSCVTRPPLTVIPTSDKRPLPTASMTRSPGHVWRMTTLGPVAIRFTCRFVVMSRSPAAFTSSDPQVTSSYVPLGISMRKATPVLGALFASVIAARNEPAPPSSWLVTLKVGSGVHDGATAENQNEAPSPNRARSVGQRAYFAK